ncbi:MAG: DNA-binding MarR family transcriptional regulator [Saprospiraceae bacterium]|jgi:DNA-binding MarR family transcriptional regulator
MNLQQVNSKDRKAEIPGFIIERTAKRMRQSFKGILKKMDAGITIDQWAILYELKKEDGLSQYELASRTFKDAPTVTRIIDILSDKELTNRLPDPEDRRRFSIYLTDSGKMKIDEIIPAARSFREKVWDGLDEKTVELLIKSLNKVFSNLK